MAEADAPRVVAVMAISKLPVSSSRTKIAPAIGALKAVASPAPAPAASKNNALFDECYDELLPCESLFASAVTK